MLYLWLLYIFKRSLPNSLPLLAFAHRFPPPALLFLSFFTLILHCSSDLSGHQILLNAFPDLPDHISSYVFELLCILITCPLLYGLHKSMQFDFFIIICPCPL